MPTKLILNLTTMARTNFNLKCFVVALFCLSGSFFACKSKDNSKKMAPPTITKNKPIDSNKVVETQPTRKAPVINIIDSIEPKQLILYIKDSAKTSDKISEKLANIYAFRLSEVIVKNKLKITGPPVAWYKTHKSPFFFEAGLPINKKPAKLPKGFYVKSIGGDSAVIAHFYGPYDLTTMGYEALNDYLNDRKRKKSASPYEIYVGDPFDQGKKKDPYKVQTDIIFPYN